MRIPIAYNLYTLSKGKPWWSSHFGGLVTALGAIICLPTLHHMNLDPLTLSRHGIEDVFHVALGVFQLLMWTFIAYNLYTLSKGKLMHPPQTP